MKNLERRFAAVCAWLLSSAVASAQIELPDHKITPPKGDAPVVVPEKPRGDLVEKTVPKSRADEKAAAPRAKSSLDLPSARPTAPTAAAGAGSAAGTPPGVPAGAAPSAGPAQPPPAVGALPVVGSTAAADFVLAELQKVAELDSALVDHAAQSLLRMGDIGRAAAAKSLASEHAPTLMAATKTLLQTGSGADAELVQARLRNKLPGAACGPLVDTLCAMDPVHASPAFLAELLAHRQSAVRSAAQRQLARLGPQLPCSLLALSLASKDSDVRVRAVQLLGNSSDPAALRELLARLSDPAASVARRAVDALALREDAGIEHELLRAAFADGWVLRPGSYALLAIAEREDRRLVPILTEAHTAALLDGLRSTDSFVAGSCAAALAGIGFRSLDVEGTAWLDLDVPHRLVRAVSAEDFSADFSSLVPTATRRMALLSGENFGNDGPRWIAWWAERATKFSASRAALAVTAERAPELVVSVLDDHDASETFALIGAARAEQPGEWAGETLYLSAAQARALFEVLRGAGVFGAERLPGARGSAFEAGRTLTVTLGARSKSFRFGGTAPEPWFATAVEAARAVRERVRWQRAFDPRRYATQLDFWKSESAWWEQTTDERARGRRAFELLLARQEALPLSERGAGAQELRELALTPGMATAEDFGAFAKLLASERFVGPRARAWLELALRAATPPEPSAKLSPVFAEELLRILIASFDTQAAQELSDVLAAAGREFARLHVADERPFVRAVAAATLARDAEPVDVELLSGLLADPEERVVSAALLALGENKVQAARGAILDATRSPRVAVKLAALRAAGMLGGDDVLTALLGSLGDRSDPRIPVAATEGIAALRDAGTASVLLSLLARGADDPCYGAARRGLLELRDDAWDELLRSVRTPTSPTKREAALILSEQLVPQVASVLMTQLTEKPGDARVAEELAILTCSDFRGEVDPPNAWWRWWEYVVHDDAQAWLVGALVRLEIESPEPVDFRGGTPAALRALAALAAREESHLAERARREFARLIGRDPGTLPPRGPEREAWTRTLIDSLEARAQRSK
ncbi:MAG: HEAT repeat domain-containing protein [Planctomycetes bacterium]|nr:HEAT repeat domain-containing protein [Planctomycetota bacterium]